MTNLTASVWDGLSATVRRHADPAGSRRPDPGVPWSGARKRLANAFGRSRTASYGFGSQTPVDAAPMDKANSTEDLAGGSEMDSIGSVGSIPSWGDPSRPGLGGPVAVARKVVSDQLIDSGFVDFTGSSVGALTARLEMQLRGSDEPDFGFRAMSRLIATFRSRNRSDSDWAQSGLDRIDPDRAVSLLR